MAGVTTFKLGWTNPLTDVFGNHPVLGAVLDLNDGVNYTLLSAEDGVEMPPPPRTLVSAGNIRTQGERLTRAIYRHNREVTLRLLVGPGQSYASFVGLLRTLMQWIHAVPQVPFAAQYQAPNAAAPVYLDVVGAVAGIPTDEGSWLRLQWEPVEITLICRPGLRGDRVTLQNLCVNPGFSAPSGPGVVVFAETFAGVGAYTVVAGAAPTLNPAATYVDIVQADDPVRYYRLGESSGTTAYDIGGMNNNGTTSGSPTQGVAGLIAGDTDTCYTFAAASSQDVNCPVSGLPSGNSPITLECWFKFAANPASQQNLISYGGNTAHNYIQMFLDSSGRLNADVGVGTFVTSAALTTATIHHGVITWDGTTLRLFVDGASAGTPTTPGNQTIAASGTFLRLAANSGSSAGQFFSGQLDECCVYATALSSTRISAHYTAGHSGATGTVANSLSVAANSQVSFGSPNWSAVNTWQVRFRWLSGMTTATWYLHFTNANNYLGVALTGALLRLNENVAGTVTHIASAGVTPVHEAWYWLQVTQFPTVAGMPAWVSATLSADNAGAIGGQIATVSGATVDSVTALSGQPEMAPTGAQLAIGGAAVATSGHTVSLFGPGGWQFAGTGSLVSNAVPASGAWEQTAGNTFPTGPVQSVGAARIDVPPAGTYDAMWHLTNGGAGVGTPPGSFAIPASQNAVLHLSVWAKSAGLGANAQTILRVAEYDANGNQVGSAATIASQAGNCNQRLSVALVMVSVSLARWP